MKNFLIVVGLWLGIIAVGVAIHQVTKCNACHCKDPEHPMCCCQAGICKPVCECKNCPCK